MNNRQISGICLCILSTLLQQWPVPFHSYKSRTLSFSLYKITSLYSQVSKMCFILEQFSFLWHPLVQLDLLKEFFSSEFCKHIFCTNIHIISIYISAVQIHLCIIQEVSWLCSPRYRQLFAVYHPSRSWWQISVFDRSFIFKCLPTDISQARWEVGNMIFWFSPRHGTTNLTACRFPLSQALKFKCALNDKYEEPNVCRDLRHRLHNIVRSLLYPKRCCSLLGPESEFATNAAEHVVVTVLKPLRDTLVLR